MVRMVYGYSTYDVLMVYIATYELPACYPQASLKPGMGGGVCCVIGAASRPQAGRWGSSGGIGGAGV